MSAGTCKYCGGDGELILPTKQHLSLQGLVRRIDCPRCDGTGKAGYVRLWTRIRRWFRGA